MKYKNIFKSKWFYGITLAYFLIQIYINKEIYGTLYLAEYLGILASSFIIILINYSIYYGIVKIYKKVTKR